MKYRFILFASMLGWGLSSCGDPAAKVSTEKEKQETQDVSLSMTDIFDGVKVLEYLNNKSKFIGEANALFLKGVNAFKNVNDLDSAKYYFTHSIVKQPTANAYYELGNVLKKKKDYQNALESYKLSEQLDFEPFANILYNISTVYALQDSTEKAGLYLEYALQAGFNNMERIESDSDLEAFRDSYTYRRHLRNGLRGMSDPDKLFWLQFKKQFPKANLPLTLAWQYSEERMEKLEFISYDFEKYIAEMRDEKFSREVSKSFYYFAQVFETDRFVGLIYCVKDEFLGEYAPLTYRLATFTTDGKLIDKVEISGRSSLNDEIRLATVKSGMQIDVEVLSAEYEKDPKEEGYWDNKIVRTASIGKETYKVSPSGQIEKIASSRVEDASVADASSN